MKNYKSKEIVSEQKLRAFVRVLCTLGLSEETIHGITSMVCEDLQAMNALVDYIDQNPTATEAEVTKAASRIMGASRVN